MSGISQTNHHQNGISLWTENYTKHAIIKYWLNSIKSLFNLIFFSCCCCWNTRFYMKSKFLHFHFSMFALSIRTYNWPATNSFVISSYSSFFDFQIFLLLLHSHLQFTCRLYFRDFKIYIIDISLSVIASVCSSISSLYILINLVYYLCMLAG